MKRNKSSSDDCDKTNSTAQADDDGKHKKHKFYKKLQENSLERCLSSSLDSSTPPPLVPLTPPLAPLMPPSEIIPTPSLSSPIPIPSLPQLQDENNQWMLKLENTILGPFNHVLMSAYYASGKLKLDHPVKRLCDTEFGSILSYFDLCFGMNPFSPLLLLPPLTKEIKADMYQRRHSFLQSFSLPVLDFLSDGQLRFQLPGPLWIPYPFLHYLRDCRVARDAANEGNLDVAARESANQLKERNLDAAEKQYIRENEMDKQLALLAFAKASDLLRHFLNELQEYCVWLLAQLIEDLNTEVYRRLLFFFNNPEETVIFMDGYFKNNFDRMTFGKRVTKRKLESIQWLDKKKELLAQQETKQ